MGKEKSREGGWNGEVEWKDWCKGGERMVKGKEWIVRCMQGKVEMRLVRLGGMDLSG
jgi:hypothetical protein